MTESITSASNEEQDQPTRAGTGLAALALVLALASLGGIGWIWWQESDRTTGEVVQLTAELAQQGQQLAGLESRTGQLESRLAGVAAADTDQRLSRLEQGLASMQTSAGTWQSFQGETAAWTRSMQAAIENSQSRLNSLEASLATVSARSMDSSAELDLAEVDYILRLAQERLQLFGDIRTADRALQIADSHIAAFDKPIYIGLRQEVASARQKLSLVNQPDYQMIDRNLGMLQGRLAALTFKGEGGPIATPAGAEESGWWARIRAAFSGLVTVRRSSETEDEIPVVADQELIRQGAWLELELARLASMRRDQDSYTAALSQFSNALERWFEPSQKDTQEVLAILRDLQPVQVDPAMPDISAPGIALNAIRASGVSVAPQVELPPKSDDQPQEPASTEPLDEAQSAPDNSADATP